MGGDIAAWCALRGLEVTLQDRELKYIEPALQRAAELFDKKLRGPGEADAAKKRLRADVAGEGVALADVVIEAIFEDREAKQNLYRQLEPKMKPGALLATNTSSIPLQELAPCLQQPARLVGLHFFNPVAKLPLVEVVSAPDTAGNSTATALSFTRQIGKLPLPCRSLPGFLVNRILGPYMAEAMELLREGHAPAVIDQAAVDFGMPMGPVELADSVGLDVARHVAAVLEPVIGRKAAPELLAKVEAGDLGRKTGSGFYSYRDGKPERERVPPDSAPPELRERLILSLLNEAAACLADELVEDADLVDAGAIFGTGFAPFRGGPLNYARNRGVDQVIASLEKLAARHGERFRPSAGWSRLA
jgi:3-hydroxyacyl-CoA dehydrogenase/enoyl-CoA hydratase/3-hydroxybutyryl-CoA epimerase